MAQRLTGGAAALRPAMTKMMAAIFGLGMSMVARTVAAMPPMMRTVTLPAPVSAPGDEQEQRQQDEEGGLVPVEPAEDGPDDEDRRARFLEQVHEQRGGDEDEDDVEVGERAFDDVPGRDAVPAGQGPGQGGGEERELGRDLEDLGDDVGRDHDGQDERGGRRCVHAPSGRSP